jgi:hypothetical protein
MRVAYWVMLAWSAFVLAGGIIGLLRSGIAPARIRRVHWSDLCSGIGGTLVWSVALLPAFPGDDAVAWAGVLGFAGALLLRFGGRRSLTSHEAAS